MGGVGPAVIGALAEHPLAAALAREVRRVHHRYAAEVVKAFRLCPFLRDPESAFGHFCVVLDVVPDVRTALAAALAAESDVVHLVYPLARIEARPFEQFAAALSKELKGALHKPPVFAAFHPALSGDRATPARLVGLVRRAPDPFVQLVPEGLQPGGTVLADLAGGALPEMPQARGGLERLSPGEVDELLATLEAIRADRDQAYAPFVEAMARATP
jgi:hypothetical protein